jgi:hypothetical protein
MSVRDDGFPSVRVDRVPWRRIRRSPPPLDDTPPGSDVLYRLEDRKARFVWKGYLRSTGSLGQRWLRRKARQDWTVHQVVPGVDLSTFWLDERIGGGGTGVCLSLFCFGYEVMRFDCFGGRLGHFHLTALTPWPVRRRRLEFRGDTVAEQVEEALFQLTQNLDFYLQLNPKLCVRTARIDREAMEAACTLARARLQEHLYGVPVLRHLVS